MDNKEIISFEDFSKLDIRIGTITSAEKVTDADRLILFSVDLGEEKERQIISGVAEHFPEPQALVGKQVPVLANLPPRTIKGVVSEGMILYVVGEDFITALSPLQGVVPPGTPVR
ncbi:MAG: hypothetical protein NUV49_00400 [Patescibacteria group bacterium]|nr:hypothetical protein [Patescibacteria group bacterium]